MNETLATLASALFGDGIYVGGGVIVILAILLIIWLLFFRGGR